MEITVNNIPKDVPAGSLLTTALEQNISLDAKGIAVAVNNAVVQKARWNDYILHEGDKVTIIRATQGG